MRCRSLGGQTSGPHSSPPAAHTQAQPLCVCMSLSPTRASDRQAHCRSVTTGIVTSDALWVLVFVLISPSSHLHNDRALLLTNTKQSVLVCAGSRRILTGSVSIHPLTTE